MEKMAPFIGYITVAYMLVVMPIFMVIISGILYAIFNAAMGGNATFKQVFTVCRPCGPYRGAFAAVHRAAQLFSRHA